MSHDWRNPVEAALDKLEKNITAQLRELDTRLDKLTENVSTKLREIEGKLDERNENISTKPRECRVGFGATALVWTLALIAASILLGAVLML